LPHLELLRADHAEVVLAFERDNRDWFAGQVPDRGDAYFAHFADRHTALLEEQQAGEGRFHVLVDDDGSVIGRFNLVLDGEGEADLGYRLAERATGRGLATTTVQQLCDDAAAQGITRVTAATTHDNPASQAVLRRAGFRQTGPAAPEEIGGKQGVRWERVLQSSPATTRPDS